MAHVSEMTEQWYVIDPECPVRARACVAAGVREHHKHELMNHVPKRSHVGDR